MFRSITKYCLLIMFSACLIGCGGDAESVKVVDEMNSTLTSIVTELDTVTDAETARQAVQNIARYESDEDRLIQQFKKLTENQDLSPAALSKLSQASTTVSQLQGRLKELAKNPKLKKHLRPLINKYLKRKSPFD